MPQLTCILLLLLLAACSRDEQALVPANAAVNGAVGTHSEVEANPAAIRWFEGSVEEAFAAAQKNDGPLFLYWGAVWCPPCQEIKSTVFKSQAFINISRLFVPVYLDGDTEQAQAWGEKFGVKGYPTMLVFNSKGEEVTRIPGGIDIDRYNTVLQLSLNQMKPTSALIAQALAGEGGLTEDDYYQLAYYSWGQDTGAIPEGTDETALFFALAEGAPAGELRSRFYLRYLLSAARQIKSEALDPTALDATAIAANLTDILESDALTLACWDTLAYYPDDILEMPVFTPAQLSQLESRWSTSLFKLREHGSLSKAEKIGGWLPKLYLATRDDAVLSETDQALLRAEMARVDGETLDSYERQSVINAVSYIFRQAGLNGDARRLLLAELDKSAAPYYFMSSLASLAEQDGEFAEAIDWRRKAWDAATGQATRFQWGSNYVRAMIRMSPQDVDRISSAGTALLAEFPDSQALFAGRNFRILKRLNKQLTQWQEEQETESSSFAAQLEALCSEQTVGSTEVENCRALFSESTVARAG